MADVYVTRSSMPPKEEYFKEIEELWDSHFLTNMGSKHQILEEQLKRYLNVENIELIKYKQSDNIIRDIELYIEDYVRKSSLHTAMR